MTGEVTASIDLTEYEVAGPIDMSAGPDGLLVLTFIPPLSVTAPRNWTRTDISKEPTTFHQA